MGTSSARKLRSLSSALPLVSLGLTACTANWNALVRYSNRSSRPDQPIEEAVYVAVLGSLGSYDSLVITDSSQNSFRLLAAFTSVGRSGVPGYWADTLKREVAIALSDTARRARADSALVASAAKLLRIELVSAFVAESLDVMRRKGSPFGAITPRVTLSSLLLLMERASLPTSAPNHCPDRRARRK